MTDLTNYISLEQLASQMHVPCFLLIRYLDTSWEKYNYPYLAVGLRVILSNGSVCGENYIYLDDINTFKTRLSPYRNNIGSPQQAPKKDCGCNKRQF